MDLWLEIASQTHSPSPLQVDCSFGLFLSNLVKSKIQTFPQAAVPLLLFADTILANTCNSHHLSNIFCISFHTIMRNPWQIYGSSCHRYVPLSEHCNTIAFNFNLLKTATRAWEIKVCTNQRKTEKGGNRGIELLLKVTQLDSTSDKRFLPPPGCLQWIYGSTLGIPFHDQIQND